MRPSHDDGFNVSQFQSSWTQFFCYLSGLLFKSWLEREKNILQKVLMFFPLHWRRFWPGTASSEGGDMGCRLESWESKRIYESPWETKAMTVLMKMYGRNRWHRKVWKYSPKKKTFVRLWGLPSTTRKSWTSVINFVLIGRQSSDSFRRASKCQSTSQYSSK